MTPGAEIPTPGFSTLLAAGLPRRFLDSLERLESVDSAALEREVVIRYDYQPLARVFRRAGEPERADRIARAIVKEAASLGIAPSLLAGVLLTENPGLEPKTISRQGAIGLMQVMRFHAGEFDCDSRDLFQVEANICHGARVLGRYLGSTGDVRRALLRYNGCVASRNTANCGRYPGKVFQAAKQVRRQLLFYPAVRASLDSGPSGTLPRPSFSD